MIAKRYKQEGVGARMPLRARETPEQREERLAKQREQAKAWRAKESAEQRIARLGRRRDRYMRARRQAHSGRLYLLGRENSRCMPTEQNIQ